MRRSCWRWPAMGSRQPRRLVVALAVGGIVLVAGLALAGRAVLGPSESERSAERFAAAWERGDYAAMYALLTPDARAAIEEAELAAAYEDARATATLTRVSAGPPTDEDGGVTVPVTAATAGFGEVRGELRTDVDDGLIDWRAELVFPGLAPGEELRRRMKAPRRAKLVGRGGETIVEGPAGARSAPLGDATAVAGTLGPPASPAERDRLYARGFPEDTAIGTGGLERVFERELAGTPGGELLAGKRVLARSSPRPAEPVKTTIDTELERSTLAALAGRLGGIVVLDARTGEVRAVAGAALTGAQPPGSTFKLVTTTAAFEAGLVKPSDRFAVETAAVIDGTEIANAGGESCGGDFADSFAHSCNSVFAPLGVKVGDRRLVEMAERYGVNRPPAIASADTSTMPQPDGIESDLALGATAIGQGELLTTPLQMASIAQTIAAGGEQLPPRLAAGAPVPAPRRVTSKEIADRITKLMEGVVAYGTGEEAAIPGVRVAGKTGTAELGEGQKDNAWFVAFAPARRPKLAVAVLIAGGGAGGEVAAPVAKTVLEAGLAD